MKTASEWAKLLYEKCIEDRKSWQDSFENTLPPLLEEIIREAQSHLPPLPMLRCDSDYLSVLLYRLAGLSDLPWNQKNASVYNCHGNHLISLDSQRDAEFVACAPTDIGNLIHDLETVKRMLGDCEELDAYAKGYAAGCLASDTRHAKVLASIMRISNSLDVTDIVREAMGTNLGVGK